MIAQRQSQRQSFKIMPHQIELLNLYFLNSLELEQRIRTELQENPFLEEKEQSAEEQSENSATESELMDTKDWEEVMNDDASDFKTDYQNYFNAEVAPDRPLISLDTFKDEAKRQLQMLPLTASELEMAVYIIDLLSNEGFIDRPLDEITDDVSFHFHKIVTVAEVEAIVKTIQSLEPTGIGATCIKDCLLMQLRAPLKTKRT